MRKRLVSSIHRLVVMTVPLVLALLVFMSLATTSLAEADYHWLDTFSDYTDSVGDAVHAFDFAPSGNLYVGGEFISAGQDGYGGQQVVNGLAMWDGTEWHPLGGGFGLQFGGLVPSVSRVIAVADNQVYISGFFAYILNEIDGTCPDDCIAVRGVARWDGTAWSGLGPENSMGVSGPAYADVGDMEFFNNELWITGLFDHAGGVEAHGIAKWTGAGWEAVAFGTDHGMGGNGYGSALATNGTSLYIAGSFESVDGHSVNNVAKYTPGVGFQALGNGLPGVNVTAIAVDGNMVYAGGNADDTTTHGSIWRYDESNPGAGWSIVGGNVWANFYNDSSGQIGTLFVDGEQLYVGGQFGRVGPEMIVSNLAVWNTVTETWSQFGNPNGFVSAIGKKAAQVFVGGGFSQIGGTYIQVGEDFSLEPGIQSLELGIYDPNALPPPPEANLDMYLNLSESVVDPGEQVDVCLQVSNYGEDGGTGITLTTSVPNGAILTSAVSDECDYGGGGSGGTTFDARRVPGLGYPTIAPNCTAPNLGESGAITCNLPDMMPYDDSAQIYFTVDLNGAPGSDVEFAASVSGNELDPSPQNNAAEESVHIRPNLIYVAAEGDCGESIPCYQSPGQALDDLAFGGALNLLAGEYGDALYIYDEHIVNVTGDVILHGRVELQEGVLNAPAGTLQLTNSLRNYGGTFNHNNGTVFLNHSGYQDVQGEFTFFNLVIGSDTIIDTGEQTLKVTGTLTNNGTIYHTPAGQYVATNTPTSFEDAVNQSAVVLTSTGGNELGYTYVSVSMREEPPMCGNDTLPALAVLRHFDISPSEYQDIRATLRLYYDVGELNGADPSSVQIYHCGYDDQTGEYHWQVLPSSTGPDGTHYVETNNVTSFSPFALGGSPAAPTATTLSYVKAKLHKKGGVAVKWETGNELNVVGFNILRSNKANGNFKQINNELKQAKFAGQPMGRKYTFHDKQAKEGKTTWYKVQVLKADGNLEESDLVQLKQK